MEEFGTEEELEFWSLSAEHMSRRELPAFTDIAKWIDLLYKAPVHFVYRFEEDKLVLDRRHIISENILKGEDGEKMPHEQTPQQKEFIHNFESQVQNIETKIDWDDEFKEHGISSHAIGQCEHIPLYTKSGDIWGVYFVGPYIKCPEQVVAKISIIGRILSSWLIQIQEQEKSQNKAYDKKVKEITSDLGTGQLNTEGIARLTIQYIINAQNAGSGAIVEYRDEMFKLITSAGFDEGFTAYFDSAKQESLFEESNGKFTLSDTGKAYFEIQQENLRLLPFESEKASGFVFLIKGNGKEFYNIEPILDEITASVGLLLDYRENNIEFSNEYLNTYYTMLRAIEKSRDKTKHHTPRMIAFVQRFGMLFGLEADEMEIIKKTAKLHDIGYVGAAGLESGKSIGGELTHPVIGANLLEQLPIHEDIISGVRTHHEWVNGSGSPRGVTGEEISWTGKIIGVFEFVIDFIESYEHDDSKTADEWSKVLSKRIMERADKEFDMVLVPTVIQLIQMLGWEGCVSLGVEE
ncbi:MAG: HD domain-containing protein [Balneolaceae bacterium]|nr:HD domain-containing protein [Balneolaceae bacterium]